MIRLLRAFKCISVLTVAVLMPSASALADASDIISLPFTDLAWETSEQGVGFAQLRGDRFSGPYMAMVRLPAGLVSPAHVKSANMFGLVISGTIVNQAIEDTPVNDTALHAGSYYSIPAGLPHISKCVSSVDCVTYLYQDGKFDFLPVQQ